MRYLDEGIRFCYTTVRPFDLEEVRTMFRAVNASRLSDKVIAQMQQLLLDGKLKRDTRLFPEREMARQLGVSRPVLREALLALEVTGVIERRPGKGTFVRSLDSDEILRNMVTGSVGSDRELFEDLLEVREVLESKAVEWATERANQQDLARIKRAINMLVNSGHKSGIKADIFFHLCISAAAHNEVLFKLTSNIGSMLRGVREKTLKQPGRKEDCIKEHQQIFRALQERDSLGARKAMQDHIGIVKEIISSM